MIPVIWIAGIAIHGAFGAWFLGAPTAENMRRSFVTHAEGVVSKLISLGERPSDDTLSSLRNDLQSLRERMSRGWAEPEDQKAFFRVSAFVASAHVRGTGTAATAIVDGWLGKLVDVVRTPMKRPSTDEGRHC